MCLPCGRGRLELYKAEKSSASYCGNTAYLYRPKVYGEELLIKEELKKVVLHYGQNAKTAWLDGVVCSPKEARENHEKLGKDFLTITPGVRFKGGDIGDQKRVMSPAGAKDAGSDYIVMGRPITQAENPVEAYREAVRQFCD